MKKTLSLVLALMMCATLGACTKPAAPAASSAQGSASSTPDASQPDASQPGTESDLAYIQGKGTLIVGITDFAPMDYQDADGQWIGFDADMARKVAEDLGVTAEFIEIDWDNKILELDSTAIDCVWNGMTLTDEVMAAMQTSTPYANNGQVVVMSADKVPEGFAAGNFTSDIAAVLAENKTPVAVEAGSAGEKAAIAENLDFTAVLTQADSLMEVASGAADACVIDLLMASAMTGEGTSYQDLVIVGQLTTEKYGIGMRKGSDLAAKIDELMAGYYADGSMLETAETYGIDEAVQSAHAGI